MNNLHRYKTWAEIDLNALRHNYKLIRSHIDKTSPECEIIAVVKADAYGHGAAQTARTLMGCGCRFFAVSCTSEALELREEIGFGCKIIILGYVTTYDVAELIRSEITVTVFSLEYAHMLNDEISRLKKLREIPDNARINAHIKVDTGMNRLGFDMTGTQDANVFSCDEIAEAINLDGIYYDGLFTHFACADEPQDAESVSKTETQYSRFLKIKNELQKRGFNPKYCHVCNSAGTILLPTMYEDAVRPGIILYGLTPSASISDNPTIKNLRPVMKLCSTVSHLHKVHAGESIGYGASYYPEHEITVATVPIGYADGFIRSFANGGGGYINRKFARVVGRICMDQCMLEVEGDVKIGDTVTFFGDEISSVDDFAKLSGTINYELVCLVGKRVPRVYINE